IAERPLAAPAGLVVHTLAPEGSRVAPPAPGAAVAVTIPGAQERTLANGLRVIVARRAGLPLLSADLRLRAGAAADPVGRAGVANLTANLVTQGTATRSATDISRTIESLGASLTAGAGADFTQVALQSRADRADPAFAVFADVVRNPAFAGEELDRARRQQLDNLSVTLRQPGGIAGFAMARAMYGDA